MHDDGQRRDPFVVEKLQDFFVMTEKRTNLSAAVLYGNEHDVGKNHHVQSFIAHVYLLLEGLNKGIGIRAGSTEPRDRCRGHLKSIEVILWKSTVLACTVSLTRIRSSRDSTVGKV